METAGTIVSISGGALLLLLAMPTLVLYALGAALMPLALVVVGAQALCRAIYRVGSATKRRVELLHQDQGAPLSRARRDAASTGASTRTATIAKVLDSRRGQAMNDDLREADIRRIVLADSFFLLVGGGFLALFWFAASWLLEMATGLGVGLVVLWLLVKFVKWAWHS